jgi:hypothetical protein
MIGEPARSGASLNCRDWLEDDLVGNREGNRSTQPDRHGQERELAPPIAPRGNRAAGGPGGSPGPEGEPQHEAGHPGKCVASSSTGYGHSDQQHRWRGHGSE